MGETECLFRVSIFGLMTDRGLDFREGDGDIGRVVYRKGIFNYNTSKRA